MSIEIAKSWTDQKFSDSRTGVLKCLVKFLRPVEILQVQDRSNSGRWKNSKCFPVTTKFHARLPVKRFSNFLCFAFQILKKTSRGLDLRESKQYFTPKPLHHIHNSFWRPNEPNGRECAVPGGALHDITRGPEGHSFQLVSVTTHQKDFGVARKIPEVRWGRGINAGTVFEMFLYCFPHIFDTNFQEQKFRNDFRLTVALLRMQVTCWSLSLWENIRALNMVTWNCDQLVVYSVLCLFQAKGVQFPQPSNPIYFKKSFLKSRLLLARFRR